jgi:hypothetical protein
LSNRSQFFQSLRFFSSQSKLRSTTPRHDLEAVQLAAFDYLHPDVLAQNFSHTLRERLTDIASITQQALYLTQTVLAAPQCL